MSRSIRTSRHARRTDLRVRSRTTSSRGPRSRSATCSRAAEADSDIILDGPIENPIGFTDIENQRGDILIDPDADVELIRTSELDLDADTGTIGIDSPRRPLSVELVKFKDKAGVTHDIVLTADAAGDVVLDLTANRRSEAVLGGAFTVTIDRITAGDDVDVVVNDSKEGNDLSDIGGVTVSLFNPPSGTAYQLAALLHTLPARCRRCGAGQHPPRVRDRHDRHRFDVPIRRSPGGRRHRHRPHQHHRPLR